MYFAPILVVGPSSPELTMTQPNIGHYCNALSLATLLKIRRWVL